jgi:hypothetical protein
MKVCLIDVFTLLSGDVVFGFNGNYYLKSLYPTMEAHYQSRINRWMAWLWLGHSSNPWLAVAAFAMKLHAQYCLRVSRV